MPYTVSGITTYIRNVLEGSPTLRALEVEGEVSESRLSGQLYFTIKDAMASLACVMFASDMRYGLRQPLEIGMQVRVTGRITVYPKQGKYQLVATRVELTGAGQINEQLLQLRNRLRSEGLFDPAHKKPLPPYPKRVGIVTSGNAAALADMRRSFRERNPYIQLVLAPCRVQGVEAPRELCRAIRRVARANVDVIIVGRGGGGRDDLLTFCDEGLVRTVYECEIPVVSAVGHEINHPFLEDVADVQVQTPTAAADLVAFSIWDFDRTLVDAHSAMVRAMMGAIESAREQVSGYRRLLRYASPFSQLARRRETLIASEETMRRVAHTAIEDAREETAEARADMRRSMREALRAQRSRLDILETGLRAMSPYRLLEQGYAYVTVDGKPVKGVDDLPAGAEIKGYLADGSFAAEVRSTQKRTED